MTGPAMPGHGGRGPVEQPAGASRLIGTLAGTGVIAGALIVSAFILTRPAIEANRARRLDAAVREVLASPARYDTLYVAGGSLVKEPPAGRPAERVFLGYRADGSRVGFAVLAAAPGFQDVIQVIFGYDPGRRMLIGMKVLENKETPGLGDKIEKDSAFVAQFEGLATPLAGVKAGAGKGVPGEVDMITGATISSRAVIKIINDALTRLSPAIEAAWSPAG